MRNNKKVERRRKNIKQKRITYEWRNRKDKQDKKKEEKTDIDIGIWK